MSTAPSCPRRRASTGAWGAFLSPTLNSYVSLYTGMTPPTPSDSHVSIGRTRMIALPPASPRRFEADRIGPYTATSSMPIASALDLTPPPTASRTLTSCRGNSACLPPPERASKLLAPMWLRCDRHRSRLLSFWVTSLLGTDVNPCTPQHQIRPPKRLRTAPHGPLDGLAQSPKIACSYVAAMPGQPARPDSRRSLNGGAVDQR